MGRRKIKKNGGRAFGKLACGYPTVLKKRETKTFVGQQIRCKHLTGCQKKAARRVDKNMDKHGRPQVCPNQIKKKATSNK